jgi:hypothetical protein
VIGMKSNETLPTDYQKIPGKVPRRRGFSAVASRCRLHLAEDHILSVDNHGFTEDYRRFYFSDILAPSSFERHGTGRCGMRLFPFWLRPAGP